MSPINPIIRPETHTDEEAISKVTMLAFGGKPYSDGTEQFIIERLRDANALSLSLVAELGGTVIGHVAFSVVLINGTDKGWFGLGPISVLPELQKQGTGSKLIQEGLSITRKRRERLRIGRQPCILPTLWLQTVSESDL